MAGVTRAGAVPFYTCEDLGSTSSTQRRHLLCNFQNLLSIFLKLGNIRSFTLTLAFWASQDLAARARQSHCQVLDDIKGTEFRQAGQCVSYLGSQPPYSHGCSIFATLSVASTSFISSLSPLSLLLFLSFLPYLRDKDFPFILGRP